MTRPAPRRFALRDRTAEARAALDATVGGAGGSGPSSMATEPSDLANCDREPIHLRAASSRTAASSPATAGDAGAAPFDERRGHARPRRGSLRAELARRARAGGAPRPAQRDRPRHRRARQPAGSSGSPSANGRRFDVAVHRADGRAILEFEPPPADRDPLAARPALIGRISDDRRRRHSSSRARPASPTAVLGYDRVMICRFEPDGAGKVVSEVKRPDLESFLGQYFPASDIPQQARASTCATPSASSRTRAAPGADRPGARRGGRVRSTCRSPTCAASRRSHCEYLRNMGVAASMSISVIVDGRLWGLIACHHYAPRVLSMAERTAAELFGQFFSLRLHALKQKRSLDAATEARRALDRFLRLASQPGDIEALLRDNLPDFARLLPCDGVGLWIGGAWSAPRRDAAGGGHAGPRRLRVRRRERPRLVDGRAFAPLPRGGGPLAESLRAARRAAVAAAAGLSLLLPARGRPHR